MFTGLVEARGRVREKARREDGLRLAIEYPAQGRLQEIQTGASIAVNGVCLSAAQVESECFYADLGPMTVARTTLGDLEVEQEVNLEPALRVGDPMGGHLVSGHVDAVGRVAAIEEQGDSCHLEVEAPAEVQRYLVPRGSICIDGVSLTVTQVEGSKFGVMLIPHTREMTLAGSYQLGQCVNLEVDLLARYLERLLEEREDA